MDNSVKCNKIWPDAVRWRDKCVVGLNDIDRKAISTNITTKFEQPLTSNLRKVGISFRSVSLFIVRQPL